MVLSNENIPIDSFKYLIEEIGVDVGMPVMSGTKAFKFSRKYRPNIPRNMLFLHSLRKKNHLGLWRTKCKK